MNNFLKLAEKIDKNLNNIFYLCNDLPTKEASFIEQYFKPTREESINYCMGDYAWLNSFGQTRRQNNKFRIMVLLFANELYNDLSK